MLSPRQGESNQNYVSTVAAMWGQNLHQIDFNNAFPQTDSNEEVYKSCTPDFSTKKSTFICKVLTGLSQASQQWNVDLTRSNLFNPSVTNLFAEFISNSFIPLPVYVDGMVFASSDIGTIKTIEQYLDDVFKIKDLGAQPLKK